MTETMSQPVSERHLSIARCTLQAITLPFARADRLVLAGLPFLALCGIGWLWNGNLFYDFVKPISLVTLTVPALQEFGRAARSMSGIDGIAWFISLTTLAFWLCAWQRAIATGFREPLADWLIASLRRMPQYLAMFGAWAIVGFVVFALSNALYSENLWLSHFPVIDPNGLPRARAPLTISVGLLASLFVYVRLAPLTALAAWDGRGSPRDAARIASGWNGLRLMLAVGLLLVLGWALAVFSRNASFWIAGKAWPVYAFYFTRLLALLTQIWLATLAALSAAPPTQEKLAPGGDT